MVNKTADCFNNIVLVVKISRKNLLEKMENNSTLEKILLVFNRYAELLQFLFQSGFFKKDDEEKFDHSEKFAYGHFLFYWFCRCLHLSCQISIESVRNIFICSLNILMTVVYLKFFSIL